MENGFSENPSPKIPYFAQSTNQLRSEKEAASKKGNSLENYNTLERYFGMDFGEWLEFVESWKWIVDRIVFQ